MNNFFSVYLKIRANVLSYNYEHNSPLQSVSKTPYPGGLKTFLAEHSCQAPKNEKNGYLQSFMYR